MLSLVNGDGDSAEFAAELRNLDGEDLALRCFRNFFRKLKHPEVRDGDDRVHGELGQQVSVSDFIDHEAACGEGSSGEDVNE